MPSLHPGVAAICTLLACAALPGQEAAVLKDLAVAEEALAQKRGEAAALAVQSAARRLRLVPDAAVAGELQQRLAALRDKADPVAKTADEACKEAAAALLAVAKGYEERGWLRSARDLLVRAAELDPDASAEALARVRGRLSGAAAPAAPDGLKAWFGGGETIDGPEGWVVEPDGIAIVPPTAKTPVTRYLSGLRVRSDRLRVSCTVPRESVHGIGLLFAWRHAQDFMLAVVRPSNGRWFARIAHATGGNYTMLAEEWLPAVPQPQPGQTAAPLDLALSVDGTALRFSVNGVELKATTPEPLRPGFLGIQTEHTGPDGAGVRLANVAIDAEVQR